MCVCAFERACVCVCVCVCEEDGPKPSKGRFFFKNFMDEYPVVGAIEIASRDAIEALHTDGHPFLKPTLTF